MTEKWEPMNSIFDFKPGNIRGLLPQDQTAFSELIEVWQWKLGRNQLKKKYYDQKNKLKDLGIAVPPVLKKMECALGWPAKAVDMLSARSRFDGFVLPDEADDYGINDILKQNNFPVLYRQATTSELIHSCSFITVSKGGAGDPPVVMSAYDAETAAALWDNRRKKIKSGLTIVDVDPKTREPTQINLYTNSAIIEISRNGNTWDADYKPHKQGRPLMEPMVYRPSLDRPFGKSRVSRAVMSITDSAIRTAVRTEVSSEFFTSPQKYLLGADPQLFKENSKWEAYIGSIFAVSKDEDGDIPSFGQLPQASMQPHMDYMRNLAAQFAGETGIPISSLGVIHDNPASAEAIYAAKEDLIIEAEGLNETNGAALRNIGLLVAAISANTTIDALPDNAKKMQPRFRNPAIPSVVSQSDAIIKQVSAIPWIAESQVALEELGYTESQITRLLSDKRKFQSRKALEALMASGNGNGGEDNTE